MLSMLQRAVAVFAEHWRLHGLRGLLAVLAAKVYWQGRYVRLRVDLGTWEDRPEPPGSLTVREGTLEELRRFRDSTPELPVQFYEDRLHGARTFYLGFWDGEIAHVSWVFESCDRTPQVVLGPGEVELNGAYTRKPFRGRGLLPAVERGIIRGLKARGYRTVYTHVAVDNVASLRGVAKAGFRPVGVLTWRWIAGVSWRSYEPDEQLVATRSAAVPESAAVPGSAAVTS